VPSCLDAEDLAALKMRGASPAAAYAPVKVGALPGGTVIEADRAADGEGITDLAGQRVKLGAELARRRVTLLFDGHIMHVISGDVLAKTLPSPIPSDARAKLRGARIAQLRCPHRLPARAASSARSLKTASSWLPSSACASAPTSASPATAARSPWTPHRAAPYHPFESQHPHPACPASPEPVCHVVSRSRQATPETTHHSRGSLNRGAGNGRSNRPTDRFLSTLIIHSFK